MFRKGLVPYYLFVFLLIVYIANLSRSVYAGDVGDLVTAAYVGGVAHPPGYPLFTLLGFLLSRISLFLPLTPAFAVGLISAISSALAVTLYYRCIHDLLKSHLVALISSLILAFTYLFWFYAEIAEVFALNNLFAIILIFCAILYRISKKIKYFYLLAFFTGLSLTNHHTIVLLFPSLLILIFPELLQLIKRKKKNIIIAFLLSLLGFSVYSYVIIASLNHPVIDWLSIKNLTDTSSFMDLFLRRRYGTFQAGVFGSVGIVERLLILKNYFIAVGTQLTLPVIVFVFLGIFYLLRKNKVLGIALLLAYILTGPVFIAYAGFPLLDLFRFGVYERFISLSVVVVMFMFPFGLFYFLQGIGKVVRKELLPFVTAVFFILPSMLFFFNFPKTDLSHVWIGDNFGADYLLSVPKNSIVFLSGDTTLFNTWYMHYALHVRPDVTVLNSQDPIQSNEILTQKFIGLKSGKSFNDSIIAMKNNIASLASTNTVVSDIQITGHKMTFYWVPYGNASLLVTKKSQFPTHEQFIAQSEKIWSKLHVPLAKESTLATGNLTIADIPNYYANGLLQTGYYFLTSYNDQVQAERYYKKALAVQPDYAKAYFALGFMNWSKQNNCSLGIKNITKAIDLNPNEARFYQVLYVTLKSCKGTTKNQEQLKKLYNERFKSELAKDLKETK